MEKINGDQAIALLSLAGLVAIGSTLIFFSVPTPNSELLATIAGALANNLTVGGGAKRAMESIKATGPGATINAPIQGDDTK